MADLTGRTLGKYRLTQRLGRGGMAEVYRAYQPNLERDVAVKVMHGYLAEEEGFVVRFKREATSVAALRHPHIVQVYDFDVEDDIHFMVMEYIDGETLKARLQQLNAEGRRMPLEEVARVFCALCDALDYAHAQGRIHRDIKPANIMFDSKRLVLTDFGIASIVGGTRYTASGAMVGTPAYMSPEQGLGEPGDVRSDVYSLGVILYEMVTGRVPYDADTPLAIVLKHLNEPLPLPRQVSADVPPVVEHIILKALAKSSDDRYQSAGALANALEVAVKRIEMPTEMPSEPLEMVWEPVSAAPRPKRLSAALIGVAGLIVVGLIAAALLVLPKLTGETPVAEPIFLTISAMPTDTVAPPTPTPMSTDTVAPSTPTLTPTDTVVPSTPTPIPPPTFRVIGEYRTSGSANGLFVANNMLNLANGVNGLIRLYVGDRGNPKLVDTYLVGDLPAQRLVVNDEIAYVVVGDHMQKLIIMQLGVEGASTTFPPEGSGMGGSRSLYNVAVADGLAHLTGHNYWGILDVSDPMQPREIWTWTPPSHSGNPCNAVVEGSIAYIGCGWAGLYIFDVTDPQSPELLGQFKTPDWIIGITVVDQVLYLTLGESGLLALDVSDPARPLLMDRLNLPGFTTRLSVAGDTLYIIYIVYEGYTEIESGVIAVNVADPEALTIIATYDQLYSGSDIQAVDDVVFVTDETRGVIMLNLGFNVKTRE
ncbi:MAG: protein kinase [Anaerolineae bacterium]|nr:protein kinase [Anaerolineae bacterium]